jgi:hypothetical protein
MSAASTPAERVCGTSSINRLHVPNPEAQRDRWTNAELKLLREHLYRIAEEDPPSAGRHLYYCLVGKDLIDKTEKDCRRVYRELTRMRLDETMPFEWIADNTRWIMRPDMYESAKELLDDAARTYAYPMWKDSPVRVEVWCESDSIASILIDVTWPLRVPLMALRGYSSLTFLHQIAAEIKHTGKPVKVYYFGDHDPSGQDILKAATKRIKKLAIGNDITIEKVAITPEQIEAWHLPTRPPKESDPRSGNFKGRCVEIEALPVAELRRLAEDCIRRHIDSRWWDQAQKIEEEQQALLEQAAEFFGGVA